jgi:hypothetical protein
MAHADDAVSQLIHEKQLGFGHIAKLTARVTAFCVTVPTVTQSPELTARRHGATGRTRAVASSTAASVSSAGRCRRRRAPSLSSACSTSLARPGTRRSARPGEGSGSHCLH